MSRSNSELKIFEAYYKEELVGVARSWTLEQAQKIFKTKYKLNIDKIKILEK